MKMPVSFMNAILSIIVLGMAAQQPSVQLELDQRRSCGYKRYLQEDGDIPESTTRYRYRRRLDDVQVEEIVSDSNDSEASNPVHTRNFLNEEAYNAKTYQEENLVEAGFQIDVHNKEIIEQADVDEEVEEEILSESNSARESCNGSTVTLEESTFDVNNGFDSNESNYSEGYSGEETESETQSERISDNSYGEDDSINEFNDDEEDED